MDWNIANLTRIALRAITHQREIERVSRRAVDLLFEVDEVHRDLMDVIRAVAPELLPEVQRRLEEHDARSRRDGANLN